MEEILPGVMHWSAVHPNTGLRAHSAFHVESGTLIDPMVPEEGLGVVRAPQAGASAAHEPPPPARRARVRRRLRLLDPLPPARGCTSSRAGPSADRRRSARWSPATSPVPGTPCWSSARSRRRRSRATSPPDLARSRSPTA